MWRIAFQLTDKAHEGATAAVGVVGQPSLDMVLSRLRRRLMEAIGGKIRLEEEEVREAYRLVAVIEWSPSPTDCSPGPLWGGSLPPTTTR